MSNINVTNPSPPQVTISQIDFNGVTASCDLTCPCTSGQPCAFTTNQIGIYTLDITWSCGLVNGCIRVIDSSGAEQEQNAGSGGSGVMTFNNVIYDGYTNLEMAGMGGDQAVCIL